MLTAFAAPSLVFTSLLLILLNTSQPLTGGNCKRSPTNKIFLDPNHSSVPNISSKRMCKYARFRLDTIDTSSTIIILNF